MSRDRLDRVRLDEAVRIGLLRVATNQERPRLTALYERLSGSVTEGLDPERLAPLLGAEFIGKGHPTDNPGCQSCLDMTRRALAEYARPSRAVAERGEAGTE